MNLSSFCLEIERPVTSGELRRVWFVRYPSLVRWSAMLISRRFLVMVVSQGFITPLASSLQQSQRWFYRGGSQQREQWSFACIGGPVHFTVACNFVLSWWDAIPLTVGSHSCCRRHRSVNGHATQWWVFHSVGSAWWWFALRCFLLLVERVTSLRNITW